MSYFTGDRPTLLFTVTMESVAVNLTGTEIHCLLDGPDDALLAAEGASTQCTITDAAGGLCSYQLPSGGFDLAGAWTLQLKIYFDGATHLVPRFCNKVTFTVAAPVS